MNPLYKDLATIYEAMYHSFIDYPAEYDFYSGQLLRYHQNEVLEIGSGTGNLAKYFIANGFVYKGLDYSEQMIDLAKKKISTAEFIKGDMRDFKLNHPVGSIIATGRTLSYLRTNDDIRAAFSSFYNNLIPDGILCFDCIDIHNCLFLIYVIYF